ncbi:MAG: hypothetical protein RLZZ546_1713 [Bacteroidota bacterium]
MKESQLIDRDLFFGNPEIAGGQLSPDGKFITFMKAYNGILNIWIKAYNDPFDEARLLTKSERPIYSYFWSHDSKYVLYLKDKDGDENINLFIINPSENEPDSKNITPFEDVRVQVLKASKINTDVVTILINHRDKAWHDLYNISLSSRELSLLYENNDRITGYELDWDDQLRILYQTLEDGTTLFLLKNEIGELKEIYKTLVTETAYVAGWTPDNTGIYIVTNVGSFDKTTLCLMDLRTLQLNVIEQDANDRVDFGNLSMDENTREIICTSYTDHKTFYLWRNDQWAKMYHHLQHKFEGREISFLSFTADYDKNLFAVGGDRYASEVYLYDRLANQIIYQYTPRPQLKEIEDHLSPMEYLEYPSSDGLLIPAYFTSPIGVEKKNLPLVVLVHGGPKGPRDFWGYDPEAQFLANRGYAVLQPNFRASGGYGKNFLNAGDLQWGKLMQDDITFGVNYLIKNGTADKTKIAIMGGSYGGYATLAGLTFTPDLYTCGIDIVGPSNIFTLLESIPPYWEAGKAFLYGMVGDPNTIEGEKRIREASPLFYVDNINKPLLIIQGANDPRVKQAESDQIVKALKDKGKKVEYLLAKDEGHGFAKPLNKKAMYAKIEQFLSETLGGRYQNEIEEDVAKALKDLKVEI